MPPLELVTIYYCPDCKSRDTKKTDSNFFECNQCSAVWPMRVAQFNKIATRRPGEEKVCYLCYDKGFHHGCPKCGKSYDY